jgi:hypothetical protein
VWMNVRHWIIGISLIIVCLIKSAINYALVTRAVLSTLRRPQDYLLTGSVDNLRKTSTQGQVCSGCARYENGHTGSGSRL